MWKAMRTRSVGAALLGVGVIAGLWGCSLLLDPDSERYGVSVVASLEADKASLTRIIRNERSDTIFHHVGCSWQLERNEAGLWNNDSDLPFDFPRLCPLMLVLPLPIGPGEEDTTQLTLLDQWLPGEYRFNLWLFDKRGEPLPEAVRVSNSFRVGID